MRRLLALVCACAIGVLAAAPAAPAAERAPGDTTLFARIPTPGFPARAYVAPTGRVYEGTYDNPLGDTSPSRVLEFGRGGTLLRSWTIAGQDLSAAHGIQVATSDSRERLVLLDKSPGRALILNPRTGRQRIYSTFADLPTCSSGSGGECSPALIDQPPAANYAAWGPGGSLYVTDFQQAVIWRIAPGGGAATVWLADRRLDGAIFGTTGLVLRPDHRTLLVAQQSGAGLAAGDPTTGRLYSVRIEPNGAPGELTPIWESEPIDAPDGFWLARSGNAYVALAGGNQIAVLDPTGREIARFGEAVTGANGSPVPFDAPTSVMFLGRRLIVANQSFLTGDAANQAILDVYAGERGMPEWIPARAGRRAATVSR